MPGAKTPGYAEARNDQADLSANPGRRQPVNIHLIDMVLVPEARLAHELPTAIMPKPPRTRRLPLEVAEKPDRIALDVTAKAFGTGIVIDGEPRTLRCDARRLS
jgi:hypothetical protein